MKPHQQLPGSMMNNGCEWRYRLHPACKVVALLLALISSSAIGQEKLSQEQLQFFEAKIRPVLVDRCYACHSEKAGEIQGGLLLDTREGIRRGGDSGAAVVPGNLQASLLISAIRYTSDDLEMPPRTKVENLLKTSFATLKPGCGRARLIRVTERRKW